MFSGRYLLICVACLLVNLSFYLLPVSCKASSSGRREEYQYGEDLEDYYASGDLYDALEEIPSYSSNSEIPHAFPAFSNDKFRVECSSSHLTLTVLPNVIPQGLEFYTHRKKQFSSKRCIQFHENYLGVRYRVDRSCTRLISREQLGSSTFYRHEAFLVPVGTTMKNFRPALAWYAVVVECESFRPDERNRTHHAPRGEVLRPERRVFEVRVSKGAGGICRSSTCPYGKLCLPAIEVDGYYCLCNKTRRECNPQCPPGYYGCDKRHEGVLKCISNGWLCDERFDCPLKDDEESCAEIWSPWGPWSKCSNKCIKESQKRYRRCDISFQREPERCKLYSDALGCSRECVTNNQVDSESRMCDREGCSQVTCDRHHLTVVIPREPDMTARSIQEQMSLGGNPKCKPTYNETHVIFVTFLHKCNTTSQVDDDMITYRNEIRYLNVLNPSSIIMRDMGHSYSIKCQYKRKSKVELRNKHTRFRDSNELAVLSFATTNASIEEQALEKNNFVEHFASGDGEFEFKMDLYPDVTYNEPYHRKSYPLHKKLHDEIFVAIHFHTVDDDLSVMIDRCVATPTFGRETLQQEYVFIENGCPVDETVNLYINDVSPRSACFSIEAFRFVDSSRPFVYFQCDVIVCDVEDKFCRPNCDDLLSENSRSRKKRSSLHYSLPFDEEQIRGHVIQGPIVVFPEENMDIAKYEGSIEHSIHVPVKGLPTFEEETKAKAISGTSYIIVGITGGTLCLLVGVFAGAFGSRKLKKKPTAV